ncbi:MAG: 16S rRNA processing protein RimM [Bacteroidetes bacterium 4572_77]|nr:MAG: 16S rRNA processing protein RimM [Bacteroidetes bacterium 4572_77]
MEKKDCYYLGKITKTNGYKGGVNIFLDVDDPHEYQNLDAVFVEVKNTLIPYFIEEIVVHNSKKNALVFFEDIDHIDTAQLLVNRPLYLPLTSLPKLKGNKFYFHEVVGYSLLDEEVGLLGVCKEVLDYPNQALFQVYYQDKEILIPINDDIVVGVDRLKKEIQLRLPEGLLEVYLDEE